MSTHALHPHSNRRPWRLAGRVVLASLLIGLLSAPAAAAKRGAASSGGPTIYWSCAGTADVYINGRPLREAKADFLSRGDESGHEYSAKADLRVGDIITVGARRGAKMGGFRLVAHDENGHAVWQTETSNWKVFSLRDSGSARRFFTPAVYGAAAKLQPTAPGKNMPASEDLAKPKTVTVDHIWYQEAPLVFFYAKVTQRRNFVRLPLLEMGHNGKVQYIVNNAELTGLSPDDLDDSNRVKGSASPMHRIWLFREPVEVHGVLVSFASPNGSFLWQVECADNRADMDGKKGSYRTVIPTQSTGPHQALDLYFPKPIKAACWQLSAKTDNNAGSIGLHKFDLLAPSKE